MVKRCNCQHKSQDKLYGKGNRVHNIGRGRNNEKTHRCTVCGKES